MGFNSGFKGLMLTRR